ncbi:MAG: TerC family protein [Flavobacteriia bacterium]|nr:TerC family protein [Flavobacteriia bacterium]
MLVWVLFTSTILLFLALDLGVFNRVSHEIKTREAAVWTTVWIAMALGFSGVIWWLFDGGSIRNSTGLTPDAAVLKYITGYLIELSLSIDNVFVIAVIFKSFSIPKQYQHRVLFWGILGAIVFRAIMIFFGVALINKFDWIIYVFGVFLLYTAYKMLKTDNSTLNLMNSFIFRNIRKFLPFTAIIDGEKFFIRRMGKRIATPLFMALLIIELTDILFALDSIPAILAITTDPFIVFSSNIFAILGLRSMYFLITQMLDKFRFINYSLVMILAFVGLKMLFAHHITIPEWLSLGVITLALGAGILLSVAIKQKELK